MNLEYLNLIFQIIVGLFIIIGGIYSFFEWALPFFKKIGRNLSNKNQGIPKETLKLVFQLQQTWWHMGTCKGTPAMQIVCHMYITNIIDKDIIVTGAILKKPMSNGIAFIKHPTNNIYGRYPVLKGQTSELNLDIWVQPPVKRENEIFKGDVAIIDQFGNKHWIKGIEFKYR